MDNCGRPDAQRQAPDDGLRRSQVMFIGDLTGECFRKARVEFEGKQDVLLFQDSTITEETNGSFTTKAEQSHSRENGVIEQAPQLRPFAH